MIMPAIGYIYALLDPRVNVDHVQAIRYIGMTRNPLPVRLRHHRSEARKSYRDYYSLRWMRCLQRHGLQPIIVELEQAPIDLLPERERKWIAAHRSIGCRLTNSNDGGPGTINPIEEVRAKMRNRIVTAETRAKIAAANVGKKHSAETRAKLSRKLKGVKKAQFSLEHCQNMSRAKTGNQVWLGRHHTEETKRKCAAAKVGNVARLGIPHSEEAKRKIGLSHAGDKSCTAKLTWDQVRQIRYMVSSGSTQTAAAKQFGVTPSVVSEMVRNRIWVEHE